MRRSKILEKLRAGKPALVTNTSVGTLPLIVEMAGRIGFDGVWIDMEHRDFTWRDAREMITAGRVSDADSLVRIRKGEGYTTFFRAFEDGAAGIMVPHVKTPEEAEDIVQNAKYWPLGRRGFENVMYDSDCGLADPHEYLEHANRETFIAIQIEDKEGVEAIDEIAAVEAIDVLFIGPGDMTQSYGVPLQITHPLIVGAIEKIAAAAERNNRCWGIPCGTIDAARERLGQGARLIAMGADLFILREALQKIHTDFHTLLDAEGTSS